MKAKDLRGMGVKELEQKITEIRKELMHDYAQISAGTPPKSPGMLKQRKRTIARILTLLNEKESGKKNAPLKKEEIKKQ